MLNTQSFSTFDAAAHEVLAFLHDRIGFDLWIVTRLEGENWVALQANDHSYGIETGAVSRWADSFCSHMVAGRGPRIAPAVKLVPAYASAPIASQIQIGAYIGVPLNYDDGSLFGTLCAIHPTPQAEAIVAELPLVELLAKLLNQVLVADLRAMEQARCAERALAEARSDALTRVYNRRGWDLLLIHEEKRCQQYGHPACVISIDLNGLKQVNDTQGHAKGDELIQRAAAALRQTTGRQDVVARVGGDEFAVLGVECNETDCEKLVNRIKSAFTNIQVDAAIGAAVRHPSQGLMQAWQEADQAMYHHKNSRVRSSQHLIR